MESNTVGRGDALAAQLNEFYNKIAKDNRIGPIHISIYTTLVLIWSESEFRFPFSVSRCQIMKLAKIKSKATYHKYLGELVEAGFIEYQPSYHPLLKSFVYLK